jgi:hypothetical protein
MKLVYLSDISTRNGLKESQAVSFWPIMPKDFAPGEFLRVVQMVLNMEDASAKPSEDKVFEQEIPAGIYSKSRRSKLRSGFPVRASV